MRFFSEYHVVSSANTPIVIYLPYIYFSDRVLRYFSDCMYKFTLFVRIYVCISLIHTYILTKLGLCFGWKGQ